MCRVRQRRKAGRVGESQKDRDTQSRREGRQRDTHTETKAGRESQRRVGKLEGGGGQSERMRGRGMGGRSGREGAEI